MSQKKNAKFQVHECFFEIEISEVESKSKFPGWLTLDLRSGTGKFITKTKNDQIKFHKGLAKVGQKLFCSTFMIYDSEKENYSSKLTILSLNICPSDNISRNRVIGSLKIDLADALHCSKFSNLQKHCLEFTQIKNASIMLKIKATHIIPSERKPSDYDPDYYQGENTKNMDLDQKENEPILFHNQAETNHVILTKIISGLRKELDSSYAQNNSLSSQIKDLNEKLNQIENEIVQELLVQLRQQSEKRIANEKALVQKIKETEEQLEYNEKLRLDFQTQLLELRFELSEVKEERETLKLLLKTKQEENENLKKLLAEGTMRINTPVSELSELQNESKFFQRPSEAVSNEDMKSTIARLEQQMKSITEEKEKYFEKLKNVQKEKFQLQESNKELEEKMLKSEDSEVIDNLYQKLGEMQGHLFDLKNKFNERDSQNKKLLNEAKDLETQNLQLRDKLRSIIESERQDSKQVNQLKVYKQQLEKIVKEKETTQFQLLSQVRRLKQQKQTSERLNRKNSEELKKKQSQMKFSKRQREEKEREKTILENQIIELNKVRVQISTKNVKLENEIKTFELKIDKIQREEKTNKKALEEKNIHIENLSRDIEKEINKNAEYEMKIIKFSQKQIQMRENLCILEESCKQIFEIMKEKEGSDHLKSEKLEAYIEDLYQLEKISAELKEKLDKKTEQNQKLHEQIYNLKKGIIELRTDSNTNSEKKSEVNMKDSQHSLNKIQGERIQILQSQMKEKTQQYDKELKQLKQRNQRLQKDSQKVLSIETMKLDKQKENLKAKQIFLGEQNKKLKQELQQYQNSLEDLEKRLKIYAQNYEKVSNKNKQEREKFLSRISELQINQSNYDKLIKSKEETIALILSKLQKKQIQLAKNQHGTMNINDISNKEEKKATAPIKKTDIIMACSSLNSLIINRNNKEDLERVIEFLLSKNSVLEQGFEKIASERGIIQQNARKISMEMAKIKANFLKGNSTPFQKRSLISSLKPCEEKLKQLISLSENLFCHELVENE